MIGTCFALLGAGLAFGQTARDRLEFEVASVRRAAPDAIGGAMRGGPGTADPERIAYVNVTLAHFILTAYAQDADPASGGAHGMDFDQISGPAWIESEKYDITANVRPGATKQQAQEMWRNLLAERFHLALHHATKEFPGYELVAAKNGPKLKESSGENDSAETSLSRGPSQ